MKIKSKELKCQVWKWKLYDIRFYDKKWDYAVVSSDWGRWVVAMVTDSKNNIALLRIWRHAILDYSIEFPRWWVEWWESFEKAAVREVVEEFWNMNFVEKVFLGYLYIDSWLIDHQIGAVLLKVNDFSSYDFWKKEDGSYENIYEKQYISLEKFENMIKENIIKDNFTLSSYAIAKTKGII